MASKLYIIGNGFDLHHGIKSSYQAFGQYLRAHDADTFSVVEKYFDVDEMFWAEFEERLASFDSDTLREDASEFLIGYGHPDWKDSANHDYQNEIGDVVRAISKTMKARFGEWIRQLQIPRAEDTSARRLPIDIGATFLNFNYTNSLQQIYGVPEGRINFIHGSANGDEALVLGHGWKQKHNLDPYRVANSPEEADIREVQGQSIIDGYFKETFKPTDEIIRRNVRFFQGLSRIDTILVMGHSVSQVDHPYFREVLRWIDTQRIRWTFSYYGELEPLRNRLATLAIPEDQVAFAKLDEISVWRAALASN